jgi:hypothetical protein
LKVVLTPQDRLVWKEGRENDATHELYPQETLVSRGEHAVERIENPFLPAGEPWIVLKGSRIGAAESYINRVVSATIEAGNALELSED